MARINEFGEILREENETTSKMDLEEIKSKIINYIEVNDYDQATFKNKYLVIKMKEEYIGYLLNEIGIRNESILRYAIDNFEDITRRNSTNVKRKKSKTY